MTSLRVGADVGGTFTDLVAQDPCTGELTSVKVPTDYAGQQHSVLAGLRALLGPDVPELTLVHGTTVITNALLEGHTARVALLTTRGFRDVLEIARQARDSLYHLERPARPEPLVPRHRRLEVDERVTSDGQVLQPLQASTIAGVRAQLRQLAPDAVAICLLHAYANPAHEQALAAALADEFPYLTCSAELDAQFREYERTSTTVLNAAMLPLMHRYLDSLESGLRECRYRARLYLVQSNGGVLPAEVARRQPVRLVMSGPAAGVAATLYVLRQLGERDAITLDMGGTSTDVCLVAEGRAETVRERKIEGRPLRVPSVAVESIGAGGGSIAWLDPVGALKVGPRSAGARPGPAAYGLGGAEPTVTDAHVVLGTIRAGRVFGGAIALDHERACRAVARIARPLGLSLEQAAAGIVQIAEAHMLRALRLVSLQRGYDPRRFRLVAYGGAGPLHAARLARLLGIQRVIVPAASSVFSALGCLVADLRYDLVQTVRGRPAPGELEQRFAALERAAIEHLLTTDRPGQAPLLYRTLDLRYSGQNYELEVPVERGDSWAVVRERFNAVHQARYGYATQEEVELINLRVAAVWPCQLPAAPPQARPAGAPPRARQRVYWPEWGWMEVPVFERGAIGGAPLAGPALVEDEQSTIAVWPGQTVRADGFGHLHLECDDGGH